MIIEIIDLQIVCECIPYLANEQQLVANLTFIKPKQITSV